MKNRAYTEEEAREIFLDHIRDMVEYWAKEDRRPTAKEKLDGLAFSILSFIDGSTLAMPGMDIVLRPHPTDKAYCLSEGQNYFKNGMVINKCQLHEHYYKR